MTIKYIGDLPDEDGIYLVRVDGVLTVAEVTVFANSEPTWTQLGVDFDHWQYDNKVEYQIEVIVKLNLEMMEEIAKQGYYFLAKVEPKPN